MKWFLLKKSFFDTVDNALGFIICNLVSALPIVGLYFLIDANPEGFKVGMLAIIFVLFILGCVISFGINCIAFSWGNYRTNWSSDLKRTFKEHKGHCLLFVLMLCYILISGLVCIPFYLNSFSYFGIFLAGITFWLAVLVGIVLMYFCPLMKYFPDEKPTKTFVHATALFYRNAGFSFYVLLITLIDMVISVFTCSIVPGVAGIGILHTDAVRLLLLREKYMLEHNVTRRKVNYSELLFEEKENLGKRDLKHFFKPWKMD